MKTALLFPGQGAQFVGMGQVLYEQHSIAREFYDKADRILGFPLTKFCFTGPEEELNKTNICQPALLVTSYVAMKVLKFAGGLPEWNCAAGLSLGEYTALAVSGALSFEDAIRIVERRGAFMQEDCNKVRSTMASVTGGLDRKKIEEVLATINGIVVVANLNSPGQIVISGEVGAIQQASEKLVQAGARKVTVLKVAGAFHSPLMKTAETRLGAELAKINIKMPTNAVISNVTADYVKTPEEIRNNLSRQVSNPVLWADSMQRLINDGFDNFYEIGPGKVLSGLMLRINPKMKTLNFPE